MIRRAEAGDGRGAAIAAAFGLFLAATLPGCGRGGGQEAPAPAAITVEADSATAWLASGSLQGDYLGQELPGLRPRLFAPGIVSRGLNERDIAISPQGDEILWGVSLGNRSIKTVLRSRRIEGRWTRPEIAPFARDPRHETLEPAFDPDGKRLWFASDRPRPAARRNSQAEAVPDADLWYVERGADGDWGEAVNAGPPVNSDLPEFFPSLTRDGTLYFTRDEKGPGQSAIWRARRSGEGWAEPERLPAQVNSTPYCFNACVHPDESWVVVSAFGRPDALGGADYYVCFRQPDDSWSAPLQLGGGISSEAPEEWSTALSPDGRWLFFMSARRDPDLIARAWPLTVERLDGLLGRPGNGSSDIWWVSADLIRGLQPR